MALEWALVAFGLTFDCDEALPFAAAALPPTPIDDEVPALPVEVPAVPRVEAEEPPDAALPPLPTVAAEPDGETEAPPVATPLALCANAYAGSALSAATIKVFLENMSRTPTSCLRYRRCNYRPMR